MYCKATIVWNIYIVKVVHFLIFGLVLRSGEFVNDTFMVWVAFAQVHTVS